MIKKIPSFYFIMLLFMSSASFAQDGQNKVMKQFNRPSITNAFITPQNNVEVSLAN
jgi:hypothetical protein